ncbi:hypothetical protein D9Q98_007488 [Chlorella vulgaris]|uniref:XRCC4 coiled-coil domain-containing protein n=1 Tax=Chlorella vulgaris TaxID=3077 RepID=A0A9D4TLK2_CHLVU|nr:hypothetical protein D9Q98_007488 [Chlorella vulgaris]
MAQPRLAVCPIKDAHGKTYFISITHRAAPGEEGSADLALTDGSLAWTAAGVTSESIAAGSTQRLVHLLASLSDLEVSQGEYSTEIDPRSDGSLSLKVLWKQPSTGLKIALKVIMAAAVPAAPVVLSMLELLMGNMAALKATCSDLLQQSQAFERQAAQNQDIVSKYVAAKEQHDRDTNAKVAALLNAKKAKLRELKSELEAAQEEVKRLQEQGSEPMDADEEGEASAAAKGLRRHGKAAYVVDDDEEDSFSEGSEGSDNDSQATNPPDD